MGEAMEESRGQILILMGGDGIELVGVDGRSWTLSNGNSLSRGETFALREREGFRPMLFN